jgi:EAL domain-containing protein (putative c-di-GMP-specific phosphodiesterase class I)
VVLPDQRVDELRGRPVRALWATDRPVDKRREAGHYEVLVRMRDEHGALVPPMAFLPAAERVGLMPAIDRWVVRHAFEALAAARSQDGQAPRFSINLSDASLNDDAFLPFLQDQFERFAIPHAQVGFEVAETAALPAWHAPAA